MPLIGFLSFNTAMSARDPLDAVGSWYSFEPVDRRDFVDTAVLEENPVVMRIGIARHTMCGGQNGVATDQLEVHQLEKLPFRPRNSAPTVGYQMVGDPSTIFADGPLPTT
jgi:hypothetical protein